MGWPAVIKEIVALLRKWSAAVAAYFAGRKSKADEVKRQDDEAEIERLRKALDREREIARRADDDAERKRVSDEYTRPDPPGS